MNLNYDEFIVWMISSARKEAEKHFDKDKLLCVIPRETAWYSICLLLSYNNDDISLANKILENLIATDGTHTLATFVVIWYKFNDLLSVKAKENILLNFNNSFSLSALTKFNDGNVNHPIAAYCNLICGGEITGKPEISNTGKLFLIEFDKSIKKEYDKFKQSQISEYNSPTYTALTICFLNIIAEYSTDFETKHLAKSLEKYFWMDAALHFHHSTMQFAGPFSRAYQDDSIGGFSAMHCALIKASRKMIFFDPDVSYRYNHFSNFIQNSLIAVLNFNLSEDIIEIFFEKKFPLYFRQKTFCEQYFENRTKDTNGKKQRTFDTECYHGGWSDLSTYLTPEFSLGTAERQYVNGGHTDSIVFRYRKNDKITNMKDFRAIYTRGVYNNSLPGQDNLCHTTGDIITKDYLYEESRTGIFQDKNIAIAFFFPKRCGHNSVNNFRIDIISSFYSNFDEINVNDAIINKIPFEFKCGDKIFIKDGNIFFSIIPFKSKIIKNEKNIIQKINDFFIISLYSYNDIQKDFSRDEINRYVNGFIIEIGEKKDYTDFSDFKNYINKSNIIISEKENSITVEYQAGNNALLAEFDFMREKFLQRKINLKEIEFPSFEIETNDHKILNLLKEYF